MRGKNNSKTELGQGESSVKKLDILYVAIGAFYLVIGMLLGIVMGIQNDFKFAPLHAHINLLGFAAHCVLGLVYRAWPELKQGALAAAQFWLFVVGSPLLLVGIAIAVVSNSATLAIVGSLLVILGALLFLAMTVRSLLRTSNA
jgi:hypothetical protein